MWKKIKAVYFCVKDKNKNHSQISLPEHLLEIVHGLEMLDFLYKQDIEANALLPEAKEMKPIKCDLKFDFITRMTAYINIICSLEGIIKKSYDNLEFFLEEIDCNKFILSTSKKKEIIQKRNNEIQDFRFWRNKVFAHTAFAYPKEDNDGTKATSAAYFSGTIFGQGAKDNFFELGGGGIIKNGQYPAHFPIISIARDHLKAKEHFLKWEQLFTNILDELSLEATKGKKYVASKEYIFIDHLSPP